MAETLDISRSSLYYRRQPPARRADRSHDEQIIRPAARSRRMVIVAWSGGWGGITDW